MSSKLSKQGLKKPVIDDVSAELLSSAEIEEPPAVEDDKPKKKSPYGGRAPKPKNQRARQTPAVAKSGKVNKSSETAVVALSSDLKTRLERLSRFQNISMSQVMRNALEEYIDAHYEEARESFRALLDEEE